jgi:hypothetical protein
MCLNETYSKVRIGMQLSDAIPIQNSLKQGDGLLPLLFNFTLKYAIRKGGLELNGTHQLLVQGSQTRGPPVNFMRPLH